MPIFEYKALTATGKQTKGTIDADTIRQARQKLRAQSIFTTEIKESGQTTKETAKSEGKSKFSFNSNKVSGKILSITTRQLATLLTSGVPLVEALQGASEQTDSLILKRTLVDLREKVQEGSSFSKALSNYPKIFPKLFVNMVAAGEASGTLDAVFENLSDYQEKQLEMKRKIISTLIYPAIMLIFCAIVLIVLLTFVVPQVVDIFKKQSASLPWSTELLILLSNTLKSYWYLFVGGLVLAFYGLKSYYAKENGRKKIDSLFLKAPISGSIYSKIITARVSSTLGTLLKSGVGLIQALDIVKNIVNNVHVVRALEDTKEGVREGRSLSKELAKTGLFPKMLPQMVAIGEKSGELENMLQKAGTAYEKEVNSTLSNLTATIEPLMIIVVGIIVLCIVIPILLPMFNMMNVIQK